MSVKVSKVAKIRNRYNQVPHLTQDTNGKVTNSQKTPQTRAKRSALSQQVTTKLIFEQSKMRDHLFHCLKENEFTNFPFSINPMWKKKKIVIIKETLFCFCRGLYDSEMAKCISCHEWFHLRCISSREVKHIQEDLTFQYSCSKCLKS